MDESQQNRGKPMRPFMLLPAILLMFATTGCDDRIPVQKAETPERAVLIQGYFGPEENGRPVRMTVVVVDNFPIPGTTDDMRAPNITTAFKDDTLLVEELLVCDRLATDVEASCRPVPDRFQEEAQNVLRSAFAERKADIWGPFDEAPTPSASAVPGITNTS